MLQNTNFKDIVLIRLLGFWAESFMFGWLSVQSEQNKRGANENDY